MAVDFPYAIPYCAAIIERRVKGRTELLMQTRWKPETDPVYSGTLEFPAGVLDVLYEDVYETLAREVKEETGLVLKTIHNDNQAKKFTTGRDDQVQGFLPFCCTQQLRNGKPWIGFVFLCEVEPGESKPQLGEVKDIKWMCSDEVKSIYENKPELLFGLELPAWHYYFRQK